MIYDRLDRLSNYRSLTPRLARAIDHALSAAMRPDLPVGRLEIDGDDVFAVVHEYATKPLEAARWEAHREYIDLQLMLVGTERMDVADVTLLTPSADFDAGKDVGFFESPVTWQSLVVPTDSFAIFFPHDAHRPTVAVDLSREVRKIVYKIRCG